MESDGEIKKSKKNKELSFTNRCILLANIYSEKDKVLFNSFDFLPLVKLYTASQKQELFSYTKIKGVLVIMQDKDKEKKNYYFRIYDCQDYSIRFSLEINKDTKKNYMKVESEFYCFNLKIGSIGFLFSSEDDALKIKKLFDEGITQELQDLQKLLDVFSIKDTDEIYFQQIDKLTMDFEEKCEIISLNDKDEEEFYEITDYLIFSGFLELFQLLDNTEYDDEDDIFNIFIDKNFEMKIFRKMFRNYDKNKLYPLRLISHDFLNIKNKPGYIELLVGHLMRNFKEQALINKRRRENDIKEKNIKWRKKTQAPPILKSSTGNMNDIILEEPDEENGLESIRAVRAPTKKFGKIISGLNPFK